MNSIEPSKYSPTEFTISNNMFKQKQKKKKSAYRKNCKKTYAIADHIERKYSTLRYWSGTSGSRQPYYSVLLLGDTDGHETMLTPAYLNTCATFYRNVFKKCFVLKRLPCVVQIF